MPSICDYGTTYTKLQVPQHLVFASSKTAFQLKGTERLEGLVEAVGSVDEHNNVHAQLYREFKPDTEIGIK